MRYCIDCNKSTKESDLVLAHYKTDFLNTTVQYTHICKKCINKRKTTNKNNYN